MDRVPIYRQPNTGDNHKPTYIYPTYLSPPNVSERIKETPKGSFIHTYMKTKLHIRVYLYIYIHTSTYVYIPMHVEAFAPLLSQKEINAIKESKKSHEQMASHPESSGIIIHTHNSTIHTFTDISLHICTYIYIH